MCQDLRKISQKLSRIWVLMLLLLCFLHNKFHFSQWWIPIALYLGRGLGCQGFSLVFLFHLSLHSSLHPYPLALPPVLDSFCFSFQALIGKQKQFFECQYLRSGISFHSPWQQNSDLCLWLALGWNSTSFRSSKFLMAQVQIHYEILGNEFPISHSLRP